ncbi:MAG: gamma-glutamylcyclotransferase family protein [Acidiferrobacter sp.]
MPLIFGYGSIMEIASAERAVKRPIPDMADAILLDYRRDWSAQEMVKIDDEPFSAAFLNLRKTPGAYVNGVVFGVTEQDLSNFDKREKNYARVDVTENIACPLGDTVWTYISAPAGPGATACLTVYLSMIADACRARGPVFVDQYRMTTEPPPVPARAGRYTFLDRAQSDRV